MIFYIFATHYCIAYYVASKSKIKSHDWVFGVDRFFKSENENVEILKEGELL